MRYRIKMKAEEKFMEMYNNLPNESQENFLFYFRLDIINLKTVIVEIQQNSQRGEDLLKHLGFKND